MRRNIRKRPQKAHESSFRKRILKHQAQRKFASAYPASPQPKSKNDATSASLLKCEDFVDFLCLRGMPGLHQDLEAFARPSFENHLFLSEEKTALCNVDNCMVQNETPEVDCMVLQKVNTIQEGARCNASNENLRNLPDFAQRELLSGDSCLLSICPTNAIPASTCCNESIKFEFKTIHAHRLKLRDCANTIKLCCFQKQLEKENVECDGIPVIGLCEVDLPLLSKTVELFGGLQTANSYHYWQQLADHLKIPKNAGRRICKLEDIYLKYILPFTLLSEKDKANILSSIDRQELLKRSSETLNKKLITLREFQKMANNLRYMYMSDSNASLEQIENVFWNYVNNGDRHLMCAWGTVSIDELPITSPSDGNLQRMGGANNSTFKCLGKFKNITIPLICYESVFATSGWRVQEDGLHFASLLHSSNNKIWYVVSAKHKMTFKTSLETNGFMTPSELLSAGFSLERSEQHAGEFIIIAPGSYYLSISTDYCCSEMVCFATEDWFLSSSFTSFEASLESDVTMRLFINFAFDEMQGDRDSCVVGVNIVNKMSQVKILLKETIERIKKVDGKGDWSKAKAQNERISCFECKLPCFLVYAKMKETVFCVNHAIKKLKSNPGTVLSFKCSVTVKDVDKAIKHFKKRSE